MASPYRITELAVFSIYHVSIPNLYSPFLGGEMKYSIIATVRLSLPGAQFFAGWWWRQHQQTSCFPWWSISYHRSWCFASNKDDTVGGRTPSPVIWYSSYLFPTIYRSLYIPGGAAFVPPTVLRCAPLPLRVGNERLIGHENGLPEPKP